MAVRVYNSKTRCGGLTCGVLSLSSFWSRSPPADSCAVTSASPGPRLFSSRHEPLVSSCELSEEGGGGAMRERDSPKYRDLLNSWCSTSPLHIPASTFTSCSVSLGPSYCVYPLYGSREQQYIKLSIIIECYNRQNQTRYTHALMLHRDRLSAHRNSVTRNNCTLRTSSKR
jgi:hypothetical protein